MPVQPISEQSSAAVIARFLKLRGVRRVYALCGGHIMPIWMRLDAEGIRIIDVRDERAAVYMAHAEAQLSGGFGVALVTAGPGVTNAMTGIANAHAARTPVLVLSGVPPRPQENRGALQDMVHTDLVRSITRYARTVREPSLVLQELDQAVSRALGQGGDPGPVYLDFPVDTLRAEVPQAVQLPEHFMPRPAPRMAPDDAAVRAAVDLLWSAKRPLFISGRGAQGAGDALCTLLARLNAAYLDTGESRGLVPESHPAVVGAMRGSVMGQADLVVTVGRRLDFQLAYGSPAVFGRCTLPAHRRRCVRVERQPPRCGRAVCHARVGAASHSCCRRRPPPCHGAGMDRQSARQTRGAVRQAGGLHALRTAGRGRPHAPPTACSLRCASSCHPMRWWSPTAATS